MAMASAVSRSGASTEPRYSPLLRIMMKRQLQRLAAVGLFREPFIGIDRNARGSTALVVIIIRLGFSFWSCRER